MKKFYISLLTIIFAAVQIAAAPVDPEKALEIANNFWANNVPASKNIQWQLVPADGALKAPTLGTSPKEDEAYYIFTATDNNGFVIVSGDDRLSPIVGYSTNAVSGEMPPALTAWLKEYSEYVNDVRAGKATPSQRKAREASSHIEPMLVTAWDQDKPYNNMCPLLNGKRTYTGCSNTAAAQVMRFHKWPASPIADVEWENNITGETEFCEMKSHVYDWENMIYSYSVEYSEAEAEAVALLMADIGKATQSMYEEEGTGSNELGIASAFVNVFDYSPELTIATRSHYTYEEYISLIRENLEERQPIVYCGYGQNYQDGHSFVCDGIDANDLLHIDWGWSGVFNGYFDIAIMEPEGSGIGGFSDRYNVGQLAIVNIKPRAEGEVNKGSTPTLTAMDAYDMETEEEVDEVSAEFVDGIAEVGFTFSVINRGHSDAEGCFGAGIMDKDGNLVRDIEFGETDVCPSSYKDIYGDGYSLSVSNVSGSEEYLPAGKYVVGLFYMNTYEEVEYMRGTCNGLILEVTEVAITLSSVAPRFEFDEFSIIEMPEHSNEELVFNATFTNKSKLNATVILVPVINRYEDGTKVKSERMAGSAVALDILDVNNIIATFTVPRAFAQSGTYTISFEYMTTSQYIEDEEGLPGKFDKSKLKSVAGESAPFEVEIIPADDDEYDYSFSVEYLGQETYDEYLCAVIRTIMGKDISEYKFLISNETHENALEAVAEYIASGECGECHTLNRSAEFRIPLEEGEYGIVFVLYDVNGEPLDEYFTCIFNLTTGIEDVEENVAGIHYDSDSNVISVAKESVIEVLDASGRAVKRANSSNISIADLETGIYIVKYDKNIVKVVKR